MSSRLDIRVALGQRNAIKAVQNVKHQTFEVNRFAAVQDRKEKKRKKETRTQKTSGSDKGRAQDDNKRDGAVSAEKRSYCAKKSGKEKDSKVRGSTVDIIA